MSKPTEKSFSASEAQTAESHPTREEIELRAYEIYVERGGAPGQEVNDWLQAERELLAKHAKATQRAKAAIV
jgi:Protein of unknown function (DUF2934)